MPLVALGIAAGVAGGAAQIYGAHKQGEAATAANATQSQSNQQAIELQKQQIAQQQQQFTQSQAQAKAQWDASQQFAQEQFNQQQALRAPYRAAGQAALSKLGDVLGMSFQGYQAPAAPATQSFPGSASASPVNGNGGDPAAFALSLVQKGTSPQAAAQQTNQQFGLGTGSQAVYYPDSNTIGLPHAYLAGPTNKPDSPAAWSVVQRAGGAPTGAAGPSRMSLAQMGISPLSNITQPNYAQAVPLRALLPTQGRF